MLVRSLAWFTYGNMLLQEGVLSSWHFDKVYMNKLLIITQSDVYEFNSKDYSVSKSYSVIGSCTVRVEGGDSS